MASGKSAMRFLSHTFRQARPSRTASNRPLQCRRYATILAPGTPVRPRIRVQSALLRSPWSLSGPGWGLRSIFIQIEPTPNADALKFLPNHRILPDGLAVSSVEYLSPRATVAPPHPSPLAAQLMAIDGVKAVFYGGNFITVTKDADAQWAHIRPEVFALITEAVTSGQPLVNVSERRAGEDRPAAVGEQEGEKDSLAYDESDDEVVGMIKEMLETRIRPAIQEDGGDIEFRGFVDGFVRLKLRGACRTCDSSTVTLKNGIEGMLMHYVEEVKGVHQVLDEEEEISAQEFARFEEKLRQRSES